MKKQLLIPIFIMGVLTNAQEKVNKEALQKIATEQGEIYNQSLITEQSKYDRNSEMVEGSGFQGIFNGVPVYYSTDDDKQLYSMNVDALHEGNVENGVAVSGDGMVVYLWDGGKVRVTHQELVNRVELVETSGTESDHATGVAGVMGSSGVRPNAIGMAPAVNIKSLNFTYGNTVSEMSIRAAEDANSQYMVSNHSYGSLTGWAFGNWGMGNGWYWWGYPELSETESALFGYYSSNDSALDVALYNAPQHSAFKSSGNNNNEGPGGAVNHYVGTSLSWTLVNDGTVRPNDCTANGGYDCLSYSGTTAKNSIVVGAILPLSGNRYNSPSDVVATSFSSFGPTDDGRIKPDVTAIGQSVYSPTVSGTSNAAYQFWPGTSFSSPAAAGVGVLLQQLKKEQTNGAEYLRSDMMRAVLTHTAFESGEALGPDYKFGYGLVNALGAAEVILNSHGNAITENKVLNDQETQTFNFTALGDEPLKVSIAWLDPAASASPTVILNDRTPKLVNDLDLRVTNNGTTYFPWKLDPVNPSAAATQGDNVLDNLEQVFIENPVAGQTYTITVSHKGDLVTPGSETKQQYYALVVTGVDAPMATDEVSLQDKIAVYPNPVVDMINIKSDGKLKNAQVKIFNSVGQTVYQNELNSSNTQSIDFKSNPAGVYMVYIKSDEGTITKKIIKK